MNQKKIAVLLWLYHTDLYPTFLNLLSQLDNEIYLYLNLCTDHINGSDIEKIFSSHLSNVTVNYFPNNGGDVLPFLTQLYLIDKNDHDYCVKLHSKKSRYGLIKQVDWLSVLLDSLLRKDNFYSNLQILEHRDMVGCQSLIHTNQEHNNTNTITEICKRINISRSNFRYKKFIAGNMFFAKMSCLSIFNNHYYDLKEMLGAETGKISDSEHGTYAHAMERLFGYVGSLRFSIGYPRTSKIKILCPSLIARKLHLTTMYNSDCYITENINIYGKILEKNDQFMKIHWLHKKNQNIQNYWFIGKNTLVNEKYYCF